MEEETSVRSTLLYLLDSDGNSACHVEDHDIWRSWQRFNLGILDGDGLASLLSRNLTNAIQSIEDGIIESRSEAEALLAWMVLWSSEVDGIRKILVNLKERARLTYLQLCLKINSHDSLKCLRDSIEAFFIGDVIPGKDNQAELQIIEFFCEKTWEELSLFLQASLGSFKVKTKNIVKLINAIYLFRERKQLTLKWNRLLDYLAWTTLNEGDGNELAFQEVCKWKEFTIFELSGTLTSIDTSKLLMEWIKEVSSSVHDKSKISRWIHLIGFQSHEIPTPEKDTALELASLRKCLHDITEDLQMISEFISLHSRRLSRLLNGKSNDEVILMHVKENFEIVVNHFMLLIDRSMREDIQLKWVIPFVTGIWSNASSDFKNIAIQEITIFLEGSSLYSDKSIPLAIIFFSIGIGRVGMSLLHSAVSNYDIRLKSDRLPYLRISRLWLLGIECMCSHVCLIFSNSSEDFTITLDDASQEVHLAYLPVTFLQNLELMIDQENVSLSCENQEFQSILNYFRARVVRIANHKIMPQRNSTSTYQEKLVMSSWWIRVFNSFSTLSASSFMKFELTSDHCVSSKAISSGIYEAYVHKYCFAITTQPFFEIFQKLLIDKSLNFTSLNHSSLNALSSLHLCRVLEFQPASLRKCISHKNLLFIPLLASFVDPSSFWISIVDYKDDQSSFDMIDRLFVCQYKCLSMAVDCHFSSIWSNYLMRSLISLGRDFSPSAKESILSFLTSSFLSFALLVSDSNFLHFYLCKYFTFPMSVSFCISSYVEIRKYFQSLDRCATLGEEEILLNMNLNIQFTEGNSDLCSTFLAYCCILILRPWFSMQLFSHVYYQKAGRLLFHIHKLAKDDTFLKCVVALLSKEILYNNNNFCFKLLTALFQLLRNGQYIITFDELLSLLSLDTSHSESELPLHDIGVESIQKVWQMIDSSSM